jgi:hypothetical protein
MRLPVDSAWIEAAGSGFLLVFLLFWTWRRRRFRAQLFSENQCDVATTIAFQDTALREVNRQCAQFTFGAERLARVPVRGEYIAIVYGPVSWSTDETNVERCFYAVADAQQSRWMSQNSDVFEPAFIGSTFSVFWVRMPALVRLTRGSSQPLHGAKIST